jgi:energy-converting hydrogenase A subunit R
VFDINNYIAFDLEGPLSPHDNAYDLMKLFPDGQKIFEVISRYDDLLALEEKEDYEPGDTLSLIVPFLVLHDISENDIVELAMKSALTGGAADLIYHIQIDGFKTFCISTSYQQFAMHITRKLGIFAHNVACTDFPLDGFRNSLLAEEAEILQQAERDILSLYPPDDDGRIKTTLDNFYWHKLPVTGIGQAMLKVKPVGGRRKVAALERFAESNSQPLSQWAVVGDSITDVRMLRAVNEAGGLAIAFNANDYALPAATFSLASTTIDNLREILAAWQKGGRGEAERIVAQKEKAGGKGDTENFHWIDGRKDLEGIIALHKKMRRTVREDAGKLG